MLLIIRISLKFKMFLRNEIQIWWSRRNINQNQNFFKENLKGLKMLKWDQDHHLQWKLTNQDPIILAKLSTLIILLKKIKNQTVTKDQTLTKMSLLALRMIWSARVQRMRSMRTKASKKSNKIEAEGDQRKTKKLLWCRNICIRSHQKRYSWINTKNHL